MIDFDKAEFLHRLDVRFAAFSALLEMHEKYIISLCESQKVFKDATKAVEKHHRELHKFINETDKKIFDFFEKAKLEADKQETSTADVAEIKRGEWKYNEGGGYVCSECNCWLEDYYGVTPELMNYCFRCGAKMDGERKNK